MTSTPSRGATDRLSVGSTSSASGGWFENLFGSPSSDSVSAIVQEEMYAVETIEEKRLRVLKLHVEELQRQQRGRELELRAARSQLKEFKEQRAAAQPQERRLFAKLERTQAELRDARNARTRAQEHATQLQQKLEEVVAAAGKTESVAELQSLLLVTTQQLEV